MHTPGPWAVHKNKGAAVPYSIRTKETYLIGEVYDSTIGDLTEVDANARLIAAAPALLEALERIVNNAPNAGSMVTIARAAIALAKRDYT